MQKRWVLKPKNDSNAINKLQSELGVNPIIARLLVNREIHTFEQSKAFFRPSLEQLHDPFLMKDMDIAISRIERAIGNNEKIMIDLYEYWNRGKYGYNIRNRGGVYCNRLSE